jgi:hypothetical protein
MPGRAILAAALSVAVLSACGSARKTIEISGPSADSVANLCFVLKARLQGIAHTGAIGYAEPAALVGRLPAQRVVRASEEAIAVSRHTAAEIAPKHPPAASMHALSGAESGYRNLARKLRGASAADWQEGARMNFSFLKVAAGELRGCLPPR